MTGSTLEVLASSASLAAVSVHEACSSDPASTVFVKTRLIPLWPCSLQSSFTTNPAGSVSGAGIPVQVTPPNPKIWWPFDRLPRCRRAAR